MTIYDALKLIATKSPNASREAAKSIRATGRTLQIRYNWIVDLAFSDPQADFTPEERAAIVEHLAPDVESDESRDYTLRIRLTNTERADLERRANAADLDLSKYVRRELGLS